MCRKHEQSEDGDKLQRQTPRRPTAGDGQQSADVGALSSIAKLMACSPHQGSSGVMRAVHRWWYAQLSDERTASRVWCM
jgi:hypothetical protein